MANRDLLPFSGRGILSGLLGGLGVGSRPRRPLPKLPDQIWQNLPGHAATSG